MLSVDSLKTCWDWWNLARKCLLKIWPMKADKRAMPGPGGDIFLSREGWFLRCSKVWERWQPGSLIMKILIYPEGAICWSRPKNFRAEVGIGPTEQMCSARLLGFLNSCSGGRSCLCLYLPTSGQLESCLNKKESFILSLWATVSFGVGGAQCSPPRENSSTGKWELGWDSDSKTAKFSRYLHYLLQLSTHTGERGRLGGRRLLGLGKKRFDHEGGGRQGDRVSEAASVAVALLNDTLFNDPGWEELAKGK